jgi:muramoyltetrapeptide carboxypeptidase LdcA involved in peptidoglycan recycling
MEIRFIAPSSSIPTRRIKAAITITTDRRPTATSVQSIVKSKFFQLGSPIFPIP